MPVRLPFQYSFVAIIIYLQFFNFLKAHVSHERAVRYDYGIFLDKLILYLWKIPVRINAYDFICDIKHLIRAFRAFFAYSYCAEAFVMSPFEYLQCRMRTYCCNLVFCLRHIIDKTLYYLNFTTGNRR